MKKSEIKKKQQTRSARKNDDEKISLNNNIILYTTKQRWQQHYQTITTLHTRNFLCERQLIITTTSGQIQVAPMRGCAYNNSSKTTPM